MSNRIQRRDFLKHSLWAGVGASTLALPAFGAEKIQGRAAPKRVLILGAGLAGMAAAYELVIAGHNVTVLEARMRAGGRVQTLREPFSDGMYAEAGAMYVADNHDWTMKYVKQLNVELDPVPHSYFGTLVRMDGKTIEQKPNSPVRWPFELNSDERVLDRRGLWEKYVLPTLKELDDDLSPTWSPASLQKYDQITFTEFLKQRGASPNAIAIMNLGLPSGLGNGADTVSALDLLREAAHRERTKQVYTIKGGSENLPLAFARRLEDKIIYGAAVVNIFREANQVTVTFSRSGRQQSLTADRVICSIPFSVLKTIPVTPGFSRLKQRLIQQVQYTSVTRVYLQSRTRFWLDAKQTGQAATDLPIMSVYPRTPNLPGMRGILESYTTGYWSRQMTRMSENERVQTALLYMSLVHPSITKNFEGGASKCWDADRYARGAYIWFKPGEMVKQLPHIATPEGRVHFAGEHASSWPGWMQGALESGNRAAREVNDAA